MLFRRRSATRAQKIQNILIVEDEPLVAFDNELTLGDAGFTVVATVNTGSDAKGVIDTKAVDFILADVKIDGGISGIEVAEYAFDKGIGVLFASANWGLGPVAFAVGWLAKPYSSEQLVGSIVVADQIARNEIPQYTPKGLRLFHPMR